MRELEPLIRLGAQSSSKSVSPPNSTLLQSIKIKREEIQLPISTTYQSWPAMDTQQQLGAAQFVPDDVEIIKFESTEVSDRTAPLMDVHTDGEVEG
jgi:hypothetical protein